MDLKNMLTGVAERLSSLREERPSAGTGYRLMAMTADIAEVIETLSKSALSWGAGIRTRPMPTSSSRRSTAI